MKLWNRPQQTKMLRDHHIFIVVAALGDDLWCSNSFWMVPVERFAEALAYFNLPTDEPAVYRAEDGGLQRQTPPPPVPDMERASCGVLNPGPDLIDLDLVTVADKPVVTAKSYPGDRLHRPSYMVRRRDGGFLGLNASYLDMIAWPYPIGDVVVRTVKHHPSPPVSIWLPRDDGRPEERPLGVLMPAWKKP